MGRKTQHVVPKAEGGWDVKKGGSKKATKHFDTKAPAEKYARAISKNQNAELIIHGRDGRIQRTDSHGGDPMPPRDKR